MAISSYDLLKKRLNVLGGNQEGRMKKEKLKTLEKALKYSEQAETVIKDGVQYRAILNKNKQKMDYDDKNISIPFEAGFKVGDIFYWREDDSHWIIYLKEGQDAYFTGVCRKAIYDIKWKDSFGVYHTIKGSVRGPVETKIRSQMKSGLTYDEPNYSLYVLMPATEKTKELKRYSRIAIDGDVWEVEVVDSISEPGILELQLKEDYIHREDDADLIKPGQGSCEFIPSDKVKIKTSLDNITELEIDEPFNLWIQVEKDGEVNKEMSESGIFTIISGQGSISADMLTPLVIGNMKIKLSIPKMCYEKEFNLDITSAAIPSIERYEILGDTMVKSFGENEYQIKYFLDGREVPIGENGKWIFENNKNLFTLGTLSSTSIVFKWKTGSHGIVNLQYVINNKVITEKQIKVESLI